MEVLYFFTKLKVLNVFFLLNDANSFVTFRCHLFHVSLSNLLQIYHRIVYVNKYNSVRLCKDMNNFLTLVYLTFIVMDYDIPKSVEQCRVKLREEFEKNRHITDIRVIDMLVIKVCVWHVFIYSVHCPIGDQILWTASSRFCTVVDGPLDHLPLEMLCHNMNGDNMKNLCFIHVCWYSDPSDCGFSCCIWSMQIIILLAFL